MEIITIPCEGTESIEDGLQSSEDHRCSSMMKIDHSHSFSAQAHHPRSSFEISQLYDFWCRWHWPLGLHHFLLFVIIRYILWGKYTILVLYCVHHYTSSIFVIISHTILSVIIVISSFELQNILGLWMLKFITYF